MVSKAASKPQLSLISARVLAYYTASIFLVLINNNVNIGGASARGLSKWSILPSVSTLDYYVHVDTSANNLGQLIQAIDTSKSANFGSTVLFAFNATDGADAATSKPVGYMRGYTVQGSYVSGESHGVEVEVLSYDNGSLNGTISLQGLVNSGTNEIAVVGGTGDFRGVRGYGVIAMHSSDGTRSVFHHTLHFDA